MLKYETGAEDSGAYLIEVEEIDEELSNESSGIMVETATVTTVTSKSSTSTLSKLQSTLVFLHGFNIH